MGKPASVGGQAVIEGVLMRAPESYAIAVRRPDKTISVKKENLGNNDKRGFKKWPFIRGVFMLVESLTLGIQALTYSSGESVGEEEQLTDFQLMMALVGGIGGAILLFMVTPTLLIGFLRSSIASSLALNLTEGAMRILIFVLYVVLTSRFVPDVGRVFEYHGAEHKCINCYEAELPLTVENAKKFTTINARCGTAFMLLVMVIAILFFSFLGWSSVLLRVISRIVLLPLIAGVSYEITRAASKNMDNIIWRVIMAPGLWLQRLTTSEPDDSQLEVALAALKAVVA